MVKITKPGWHDGTLETRVYAITNTCEACGCEWQITEDDPRSQDIDTYVLWPGEWRVRAYSSDSPNPGIFVESRCPSCGRFTTTRIGDAE